MVFKKVLFFLHLSCGFQKEKGQVIIIIIFKLNRGRLLILKAIKLGFNQKNFFQYNEVLVLSQCNALKWEGYVKNFRAGKQLFLKRLDSAEFVLCSQLLLTGFGYLLWWHHWLKTSITRHYTLKAIYVFRYFWNYRHFGFFFKKIRVYL